MGLLSCISVKPYMSMQTPGRTHLRLREWFVLEETLRIIWLQPCAMDREPSPRPLGYLLVSLHRECTSDSSRVLDTIHLTLEERKRQSGIKIPKLSPFPPNSRNTLGWEAPVQPPVL